MKQAPFWTRLGASAVLIGAVLIVVGTIVGSG
jgi:hypothetical protein